MKNSQPEKSHTQNRFLNLPVDIQLNMMRHLSDIYTLKDLLNAFPELYPVFQPYARSILNSIFWQPLRYVNDDRGVVYRWMLKELQLEHLLEQPPQMPSVHQVPAYGRYRGRLVICDDKEVD
ncbi:hypothetical protein BGW36DRAFT_82855 [Talaromyces proteolyticus]|uniref:F-box domain-containing protein n=1 Tax=Talaromyces proteolyticus TaxID=1131652 RepID=A0AAD4Q4K0_9EURO|nr:uncharacterized protein BGW36DRAFT_82855 [Talaromyces proteolyticus]KAH8703100.1 hypothetical protein BGW36DRAFT_82855 [Talaromyces proteolyticus]